MDYVEFESKYPELVGKVKPGTLRQWRNRGVVPEAALQALQQCVTKPDVTGDEALQAPEVLQASVTKETDLPEITEEYAKSLGYRSVYTAPDWFERAKDAIVASRKLAALLAKKPAPIAVGPGDPWEILSDGYARGFPGDTVAMRARYRTPGALRRIAEAKGKSEVEVRKFIEREMRKIEPGYRVLSKPRAVAGPA